MQLLFKKGSDKKSTYKIDFLIFSSLEGIIYTTIKNKYKLEASKSTPISKVVSALIYSYREILFESNFKYNVNKLKTEFEKFLDILLSN